METIGLLHPGAMGAAVGAALAPRARVLWASEERSAASAARAGLEDAGSLRALVAASGLIISVCPPHAAEDLATQVAGAGFAGIYLDANAISPARTRRVAGLIEAGGAKFVDGGTIGGPPWRAGTTRLYLSGEHAARVSDCFEGSPLEVIVLDGPVGAASALKMVYAAYSKGSAALVAAILATASREGVREALLGEWARGDGQLARQHDHLVRAAVPKAWRYVGEMEEIAATFAAAGLPAGFHEAAAALYRRLDRYRDVDPAPNLDEVIDTLLRGSPLLERTSDG